MKYKQINIKRIFYINGSGLFLWKGKWNIFIWKLNLLLNFLLSIKVVEYIDVKTASREHRKKTGRGTQPVKKYGIWDGEKVKLTDNEFTIVRNKKWLRSVRNDNFSFYLYTLYYYIPLSLIKRYIRRKYRIKTGKLISLKK